MSLYCSELFPGSCRYRALKLPPATGVRDSVSESSFPWSERHLRCVWADPAFRPSPLFSNDGRQVIVENPGRWNLEAGPDFLDAVIRTAPDESVFRGDVELHIRPADWRHHGHSGDKRYRRVIAHVTYFDGSLPETDLPAPILQIPLRQPLKQNPLFSFDSLDLPAYPFATLAPSPPCAILLKTWTPEQRITLLESAGEERLRLKTIRLTEAMTGGALEQTLYEEIMGALGYKHNRSVFQKLARTLPLERLRRESGEDPTCAYALLAGVAGLLPTQTNPLWDEETRLFVRSLWDVWWKHQSAWHVVTLKQGDWILANLRPANQPLRRLMAASGLFIGKDPPISRIIESSRKDEPAYRAIGDMLQAAGEQSYWAWRNSLAGHRTSTPSSLVGPGRAATILTNVIVPWAAATASRKPEASRLTDLPPEDDNRYARHTAHALFGRDHNPNLYHSGLRQQGLLQIFHDFCMNSRNGCQACGLPEALAHQS